MKKSSKTNDKHLYEIAQTRDWPLIINWFQDKLAYVEDTSLLNSIEEIAKIPSFQSSEYFKDFIFLIYDNYDKMNNIQKSKVKSNIIPIIMNVVFKNHINIQLVFRFFDMISRKFDNKFSINILNSISEDYNDNIRCFLPYSYAIILIHSSSTQIKKICVNRLNQLKYDQSIVVKHECIDVIRMFDIDKHLI